MSTELVVPIELPPAPHVLASTKFLSRLSEVELEVADLKVEDAATAQIAAELQISLTKAGKVLEEARSALKAPFLAANRAIDAAAKEPSNRIEEAKRSLKAELSAYGIVLKKKADEAEAARQAELARLEKVRLKEEAEEKARQDALAAQVVAKGAVEFDFDEAEEPAQKTETEKKIEEVKYAPAKVEAAPSGITFRVSLYPHVEDVNKLPDQFVTKAAKVREIMSTFCTGYKDGDPIPELDGVRFEVRRDAVSTGKERF